MQSPHQVLEDITRHLERAGIVPDLDWDYLQHWAEQLSISRLLEEVRP